MKDQYSTNLSSQLDSLNENDEEFGKELDTIKKEDSDVADTELDDAGSSDVENDALDALYNLEKKITALWKTLKDSSFKEKLKTEWTESMFHEIKGFIHELAEGE